MTIYTDGIHLITDGVRSADLPGIEPDFYAELHAFAGKIGLRRAWFQGDHYDLTTRNAATRAVTAGAVLIAMLDLGCLRYQIQANSWIASPVVEPHPLAFGKPKTPVDRARDLLGDDWPNWKPARLDPALAADKNTELMRRFAPGKRIGRRGGDHL